MNKPTELGKRYIPLTENILMEYVYVADRYCQGSMSLQEDTISSDGGGTYGSSAICRYCITGNRHTNETYFINDRASDTLTNNTLANTVLPSKKDSTTWVRTTQVGGRYYTSVDEKWSDIVSGESDIMKTPEVVGDAEYVPYDIMRIYFRANYHTEYDGFIFNLYTKNADGVYVNLLSALQTNYDNLNLLAEPMWFADKLYTAYIEYRVPSTAYLSSEQTTDSMRSNYGCEYSRRHLLENTLPWFLSDVGYFQNPSIGIDLHAVVGVEEKQGFEILKTQTLVSTLFPNKDSYDKLFANVLTDKNGGDFYTVYAYYENNPNTPVYGINSLYDYLSRFNTTFTLVHTITVTEAYTGGGSDENEAVVETQLPVTTIQTWEMLTEARDNLVSPLVKFRPILEHTDTLVRATIDYTLRITNNKDNTTIIKTAQAEILNPRRFGANMVSIDTSDGITQNHIYNRVEAQKGITVNTVNRPIGSLSNGDTPIVQVNKYVTSSFIDRRNIRVRVSPVTVENIEEQ